MLLSTFAAVPINKGFRSISVYNKFAFASLIFSIAAIPPKFFNHFNVKSDAYIGNTGGVLYILSFEICCW